MKRSDESLIDLYLDMLAAERGAAVNTLEAYRRDLEDFSGDLSEHGGAIATAQNEDIRGYLGRLSGRGFSTSTVARKLSAIRQLYRFLYAEGNRKDDPAAAIEGPKRGRALPKVLSVSHVDQLLSTARQGHRRWRTRDLGAAARLAPRVPAGSSLCHWPARLGTCCAAGVRRAARSAHVDCARQGQQGTARAAERIRQAGDARLSFAARRSGHETRQERTR